MTSKCAVAGSAIALSMACGSGMYATGTATVSGTIGGLPMIAQDALSRSSSTSATVFISSLANECSRLSAHQSLKSGQTLTIGLAMQSNGSMTPPIPGVYTIYSPLIVGGASGNVASVEFLATGSFCNPQFDVEAVSGAVTLLKVATSGYTGTFDLTFETTNEHVTGTFNTAVCEVVGTRFRANCPP